MTVLVFEKEINTNENTNNSFSSGHNHQTQNFNHNNNYNLNSVISKTQDEINQSKGQLGLFKFSKQDIPGIRPELIDLKKLLIKPMFQMNNQKKVKKRIKF